MSLSLTELRQRLFKLADQVIDTGVPLVIERRGVLLRLVREESVPASGRLARMKQQSLVIGSPLEPHESPAAWSELVPAKVAEVVPKYRAKPPATVRSRKPPTTTKPGKL